jgi:hypothetical protein
MQLALGGTVSLDLGKQSQSMRHRSLKSNQTITNTAGEANLDRPILACLHEVDHRGRPRIFSRKCASRTWR